MKRQRNRGGRNWGKDVPEKRELGCETKFKRIGKEISHQLLSATILCLNDILCH